MGLIGPVPGCHKTPSCVHERGAASHPFFCFAGHLGERTCKPSVEHPAQRSAQLGGKAVLCNVGDVGVCGGTTLMNPDRLVAPSGQLTPEP